MTKQCLCQICTCGRHKCPHRPWGISGKSDTPCAIGTEYRNEYRGHEIERRSAFKPNHEYKSDTGPMQDATTHKSDYIKHPIDRIHLHAPDLYQKPEGEMETSTVYNKEFVAKQATRAPVIKHEGMKRDAARFEGTPTYSDDYRQWDISKVDPIRRDLGYVAPVDKFGGNSTYERDYIGHSQIPRSMIRPDPAAVLSNEPFDGRTGYRQDFIQHVIPQKYNKPKDEYQQNKHPLENLTTNRRDFTPKEGIKMKSCKPEGEGYRSDAVFDGATTNKNDYKKWDVKPYVPRRTDEYQAPEGEMEKTTNYNKEYAPKPVSRVTPIKPPSRQQIDGKFSDDTTYGQDFRKWPGDRAQLARSQNSYIAPTSPFDHTSTYKTQFVPLKGGPSNSCKPDGSAYSSGAPFDGATLYRAEYTPKELDPCPVTQIETPQSRLRFADEDVRGHKYYQPA